MDSEKNKDSKKEINESGDESKMQVIVMPDKEDETSPFGVHAMWAGPLPPQIFQNLTPENTGKIIDGHHKLAERQFSIEEKKITLEENKQRIEEKNIEFNKYKVKYFLWFGLGAILAIIAITWIALQYKQPSVIKDVVIPLVTLAAGGLGGYGFGRVKK